jgi:hypothetical protein
MNNQIKLNYYDILNSIRMQYLKSKIPFNIINDNSIKLTYNEIKLKYIDNKNYFIKIDQKSPVVLNDFKYEKEYKNKDNVFLKKPQDNTRSNADIKKKYAYKMEKLKRKENKELPKEDQKKFTETETSNYLERRANYEKEKLKRKENKEFTADETAAYLERRNMYAKEKENNLAINSQIVAGYQKVPLTKIQILVFF